MGNIGLQQHYETAKKTGALRLSQKKLDEFPSNLRTLAHLLRNLDISENKFTRLPDEIGEFTLLKQINLSRNRLNSLPEIIGHLSKLECFNASSNYIERVPRAFSKLSHLKQVNLSDNRITEFPLMFCDLKHLDVLDLSKNKLTMIPDGASLLSVTELNLNQNQISIISDRIAECSRLKTLRLEENCLQLNAIPTRILKESNISMLALTGNLFEMKQFADIEGYDDYMERYTAVKKKMF
ncbi:leucine-rich repeat-containing protein 57-like [Polistes fuscatus]|uniref:leucine-rich repeat-containing protein 57-like n=1 Tax=Polistes fuscatus TaxID=30207 RepID=UPI001CA95C13|nr:leucine-rich repeat-containing protein 57-like [Polistes fuscatus]